jgi:signal transduction histidine kinase
MSDPVSKLKALFSPPQFGDPEKDELALILHVLLWITIVLSSSFALLIGPTVSDLSGALISASMTLIAILLLVTLRHKYLLLTSTTLLVASYFAIIYTLIINGGIRDEGNLVLIALLAIASFFMDRRAIIPLGVITSIIIFILYVAELQGFIEEVEHYDMVGFDELLLTLIAIITTTFILYLITGRLIRSRIYIQQQALSLKENNEQLIEIQSSLEQRTKDLVKTLNGLKETQAQLIVAKEEAEAANRAKSEFLSKISHDVKTPLNSMLGFADMLLESEEVLDQAQKKEILMRIQRNGAHLLQLIDDLLDISQIEAQALQLNPRLLTIKAFVQETCAMIQVQAEKKGLQFKCEMDDHLPMVFYADERRLRQVLINLLGNAIKFTEQGSVALRVSVVREETDTSTAVRFEVVDTGVGIIKEDISKIFDSFIQSGNVQMRAQGTGLGLAICSKLIEVMESNLFVESKENEGSRFWFDIQLKLP